MFYRKALHRLHIWANEKDRKPLVLRGARQTGKTTLVLLFAESFDQFIHLNLEKEEEKNLFSTTGNFNQLLEAIFYLKKADKTKQRTLLFIDEIQNSPKAVEYLRYFYEDAKNIYVIAAGSLLETLIDRQISFPVGRVDFLPVRPCTFEEFLGATGEDKNLELIKEAVVPPYAHVHLSRLFKTYTIIGGMPEIISNYRQNRDLNKLVDIYDRLIVSYQEDVEKYARNQTMANIIRHIIGSAFQYAGTRITFEKFGQSQYRSREMGEAFRILEKTMILQLIYPVSKTKLPLEEKIRLSPKLMMLDTGLVNHSAGLQRQLYLSNNIDEVYEGKIAEHMVGQSLLAAKPSVRSKLNFWIPSKAKAEAEIDFVLPWKDLVVPVEVKSGSSGRLRSLHRFVDDAPHNIAVRIYDNTFSIEDTQTLKGKQYKLINVPFYLTGQLEKVLNKVIDERP